jgi:hypothetical protein
MIRFLIAVLGITGLMILVSGGIVAAQKEHYESADILLMGVSLLAIVQMLIALGGPRGNHS